MTNDEILRALDKITDEDRAAIERLIRCALDSLLLHDVRAALESPSDDAPRKSPSGDMPQKHNVGEAYIEPIRLGAKRAHEQPGGRRVAMCRVDDCTSTVRSRGLCRRHGG